MDEREERELAEKMIGEMKKKIFKLIAEYGKSEECAPLDSIGFSRVHGEALVSCLISPYFGMYDTEHTRENFQEFMSVVATILWNEIEKELPAYRAVSISVDLFNDTVDKIKKEE